MTEKDRNKRLLLLLQKLIEEKEFEYIDLIETMVDRDTPAMRKSFEIMTEQIRREEDL